MDSLAKKRGNIGCIEKYIFVTNILLIPDAKNVKLPNPESRLVIRDS